MEPFHLRNILVVDQEEESRKALESFLVELGYDCETAADAVQGMEKIRLARFGLVISDLRMETTDGLELMREARRSRPDLDFIIMTDKGSDSLYSDVIAAGASDFITKPFHAGRLKSKLERIERERGTFLDLRQANQQLQEANKAVTRKAEILASISELSRELVGPLSIREISRLVLHSARHLTRSPLGFVGYLDRKTGRLVFPMTTGEQQGECRDTGFNECGGLWDWVLKNRQPLLTNATQEQWPSGMPGARLPDGRFLSVPAMAGESLLGLVALANSDRDYTREDLMLVQDLATLYALAVQRKWTEEKLAETSEYLENVFENAAEAIGITDESGKFVQWNKAAEELYGGGFDELRGKPFHDLYPDKDELGKMVDQLRRNGFVYGYEIDVRRKSGRTSPFRISIRVLKDKEGKTIGSVAVATDLSEVKDALAELKLANQRLQAEMAERELLAEELRKARDELEKLLEERTEKLSKAGDLIRRSLDTFKQITEK